MKKERKKEKRKTRTHVLIGGWTNWTYNVYIYSRRENCTDHLEENKGIRVQVQVAKRKKKEKKKIGTETCESEQSFNSPRDNTDGKIVDGAIHEQFINCMIWQ